MRTLSLDLDTLNFLATNYVPRRLATRVMGRLARIESPLLTRALLRIWRLFDDLDLSEARKSEQEFSSLRDCFVRELAPGARPVDGDPDVAVAPCDAVVGAHGDVADGRLFQLKGSAYDLADLVPDAALAERFASGRFVTLRLRASMYHRFHAPIDCAVRDVTYVAGDTYNVNPPTLARIERLFCRNERALVPLTVGGAVELLLVPVAAILVASLRLHCLPHTLHVDWRGPAHFACDARYARGDELGWFEHGSTIVLLATRRFCFVDGLVEGREIRMGRPLLRRVIDGQAVRPPSAA